MAAALLVATFLGSLLCSLPFVSLGAILGSNWDVIKKSAELAGFLTALGLLAILIVATARLWPSAVRESDMAADEANAAG